MDENLNDEKQSHGNKPLRPAFNKTIDLAKTYFNNEGKKNMAHKENSKKHKDLNEKQNNEINVEIETPSNSDNHSDKTQREQTQAENTFSENEVAEMLAKIENLTKERDEAKEIMIRNAAELENFRRRTMKEKEDIVVYANEKLLKKFSEILDTLDSAVETGKNSTDYTALLNGAIFIREKTLKLFEEAGAKQIPIAVGDEFDVDTMDAILAMPSDEIPDGHVMQIVSTGYSFHDKILKHTKVITSSGKAN